MNTITTDRPTRSVVEIDDATLERFRQDAALDDAANSFFTDTHVTLVDLGHYRVNLPAAMGGAALDLAATARRQRLLARYAPAPALASCMHLYWTGAAADLRRFGMDDLGFVLDDAAAGQIFGSGHAEAGCDVPVALSTTVAEPVDGGYRLHGRKHFGSLGPVWDQLGVHAIDLSVPERPMIVHGFVRRGDAGVEVVERWDTTAMRASQSYDTVLDGAFMPADRVAAVVPAGPNDSPVTGTFVIWALTLISNVYLGLAERAFELATSTLRERTSIALGGRTLSHNPMLQHQVASMWIELDGARATLDGLARDWVEGVDHGPLWRAKVFAAKERTARAIRLVVDTAADVAGGSSIRSDNELSRLWRDSRAVAFHPATHAFAHEAIGKSVLGIDPTGSRW